MRLLLTVWPACARLPPPGLRRDASKTLVDGISESPGNLLGPLPGRRDALVWRQPAGRVEGCPGGHKATAFLAS